MQSGRRKQIPPLKLASVSTAERNRNNLTSGDIFYNTDTSSVVILGNLELAGDASINAVIKGNMNIDGDLVVRSSPILSNRIIAGDISAEVVSANDISVRGGGNISGNFSLTRAIYVDINTTKRVTSNKTFAPLPVAWPTRTYRGGSRLHVFYAVTLSNTHMGWGGSYSQLYYKINNDPEYSLGNGGFTDVMTYSATHIGIHQKTYFLDFSHNDTNVDFSCQFIPMNRPYDGTLNTNTDDGRGNDGDDGDGDPNLYNVDISQNYAKMIITEYGPNISNKIQKT